MSGADRVRLLLAIGAEFSVGSPTLAPELSSDTCLCIKVSRAVPVWQVRAFSAEQGVAFAVLTTHFELYVEC